MASVLVTHRTLELGKTINRVYYTIAGATELLRLLSIIVINQPCLIKKNAFPL